LAEADARLSDLKESCQAELQTLLCAIQALGQTLGSSPRQDQIHALHGLGNEALSIAAVAGCPDFGRAAHSLCELADGLDARGSWNQAAIQVHLDGLQVLADPATGPEQTLAVVGGLRQVVQRALR
jgi:hypothetical protein